MKMSRLLMTFRRQLATVLSEQSRRVSGNVWLEGRRGWWTSRLVFVGAL